jgi:hypothetical protein
MGTILDSFQDDLPCVAFAEELKRKESVDHPEHYGGKDNPYEAIKVIEAWNLGFNLGNLVKYVSRAGKKESSKELEDLEKAKWYLDREISRRKNAGIRPE